MHHVASLCTQVSGTRTHLRKQLAQVPQMRSRLTAGRDWTAIARQQAAQTYSGGAGMERIAAFADAIDQLDSLSGDQQTEVRFELKPQAFGHTAHGDASAKVYLQAPSCGCRSLRCMCCDWAVIFEASSVQRRHALAALSQPRAMPAAGFCFLLRAC